MKYMNSIMATMVAIMINICTLAGASYIDFVRFIGYERFLEAGFTHEEVKDLGRGGSSIFNSDFASVLPSFIEWYIASFLGNPNPPAVADFYSRLQSMLCYGFADRQMGERRVKSTNNHLAWQAKLDELPIDQINTGAIDYYATRFTLYFLSTEGTYEIQSFMTDMNLDFVANESTKLTEISQTMIQMRTISLRNKTQDSSERTVQVVHPDSPEWVS